MERHGKEKAMRGAIRYALAKQEHGRAPQCLEPEELAAYMERSLERGEMRSIESHLAECGHCRSQIALLAGSAADQDQGQGQTRHAWTWLGWRWRAPAAAALAVLLVWIGWRVLAPGRRPAQVAVSRAPMQTPSHGSRPVAPPPATPGEPTASNVLVPQESRQITKSRPASEALGYRAAHSGEHGTNANLAAATSQDARRLAKGIAQEKKTAPTTARQEPQSMAALVTERQEIGNEIRPAAGKAGGVTAITEASGVPTPAPPGAPQANAGKLPGSSAAASIASLRTAPRKQMAPPASALTSSMAVTQPPERAAALARPMRVDVLIRTPDASVRWRIRAGIRIEHTQDAGKTWQGQWTSAVLLRAGSAPSAGVCWIAGDNGIVLLTTDGENWRLRNQPAQANLVKVVATDQNRASIFTVTGVAYSTEDAGETWEKQE